MGLRNGCPKKYKPKGIFAARPVNREKKLKRKMTALQKKDPRVPPTHAK